MILLTGANGFIGKNIQLYFEKKNQKIIVTSRNKKQFKKQDCFHEIINVGNLNSATNWTYALKGVHCVIHTAGIAEVQKKEEDVLNYLLVNTEGTKRLAEQAAEAGVRRLIFLSTAKVYGEGTNKTYTLNDLPDPQEWYSISKLKAEKKLWKIFKKTGMEIVILRLPLVYGYGVKGNILRLMRLIEYKIPLPFGLLTNKKSLLGVDNLIDIIIVCIEHPNAAGKTFLVSDDDDITIKELIRHIAFAMKIPVILFPLPIFLIKLLVFIIRRQKTLNKLIETSVLDITYTKKILNWKPPFSVQDGIKKMIDA